MTLHLWHSYFLWNVLPSQNVELLSHSSQKEELSECWFSEGFSPSVVLCNHGPCTGHRPRHIRTPWLGQWCAPRTGESRASCLPPLQPGVTCWGRWPESLESWASGAEHEHKREQGKQQPLGGIFKPSFKTDDRCWKRIPSFKWVLKPHLNYIPSSLKGEREDWKVKRLLWNDIAD